GASALQRTERGVDLRARRAEQLGEFALREPELQRHPLAGRGLRVSEREQQEAGESDVERVKGDRLQLVRGLAQAPAQETDHARRYLRARRPQLAKGAALERVRDHVGERRCIRAARAVVERRDLAEQLARGGMAKAQLAPLLGGHRQADAAFGDDVEAPARVAAAEHQLALAEARFPASRRAGGERLLAEAAE